MSRLRGRQREAIDPEMSADESSDRTSSHPCDDPSKDTATSTLTKIQLVRLLRSRVRFVLTIQQEDLGNKTYDWITTIDLKSRMNKVNTTELEKQRECNIAGTTAAVQARRNKSVIGGWNSKASPNHLTAVADHHRFP